MKNGKYGFGLVGVGMGGETHASQLAVMDEAELVACYGRNPEKAKKFAEEYGAQRYYSDYQEFCQDQDLDFVIICTPNGLHAEFSIPAAKAGKHLIVEKPIEISLEAAQSIVDAAKAAGVQLSVIYQMRLGNAARKVKQAIDDGSFGRLLQIDAYDKAYREVSYYRDDPWRGTKAEEGGGTLTTQTTHLIDLMQWLAGPAVRAFGKTKTAFHDIETEDLANAIVTFENGALGVITSSTCFQPPLKSRVEVHGTKGTAIFNGEYDELYLWDLQDDPDKIDAPDGFKFKDLSDPRLFPMERHSANLQDSIDALKNNRPPLVTGEEALKSMKIKLAIYRSAATGKEVDIEA